MPLDEPISDTISNRKFCYTLLLPQLHSPGLETFSLPAQWFSKYGPEPAELALLECKFSGPHPILPSRPTKSESLGWGPAIWISTSRAGDSDAGLSLRTITPGKCLNPSRLPFSPSPCLSSVLCPKPAYPSSSAAPSLTHLSGSNSKPISYKKHSLIDNDYASCLHSIFIFQRPLTCIVSSHLPKKTCQEAGRIQSLFNM